MDLKDLLPAAMIVVVAGIGVSIGAKVLANVASGQTGTAAEVTNNATAGLGELGDWFPTIGLVVAAAVVLGLLLSAFYFKKD